MTVTFRRRPLWKRVLRLPFTYRQFRKIIGVGRRQAAYLAWFGLLP